MESWRVAIDAGIVPEGPFNPSLCRCYEAIVLSGGDHRSNGLTLRRGSACEVAWSGDEVVWQMQPALDSDNDSEGVDIEETALRYADDDDDIAATGAARQKQPPSRRGKRSQAAAASAAVRTSLKRGGGHRRLLPLDDESSASAEAPSASAARHSTAPDSEYEAKILMRQLFWPQMPVARMSLQLRELLTRSGLPRAGGNALRLPPHPLLCFRCALR